MMLHSSEETSCWYKSMQLVGYNKTGLVLTAVGTVRTCCKLCCISGFCISVIQPLYLSCTVMTATPSNLWMLSNSLCRRHSCGISLLAPAGSSRNETHSCYVCGTPTDSFHKHCWVRKQRPQDDSTSLQHEVQLPQQLLVEPTACCDACYIAIATGTVHKNQDRVDSR